jgi:Brp/Blh family beta-carotene 15,15'-monooxygenase
MKEEISISSNLFICIATIICSLGGLMNWFDSMSIELVVAAILILTIGLPHGATDLLLFRHLKDEPQKVNYTKFSIGYLSLIAIYGVIWVLFPKLAFSLFLLISIYHFGQSNLSFIKIKNSGVRFFLYFLSGSFVILTPLSIYFETTMNVVQGITGISSLSISHSIIKLLPRTLLILNIWVLFYFFSKNYINKKALILQLIGLALLMVAFYALPLILGFTVYFVFWHSFGSMIDQVKFIRKKSVNFSWLSYFRNALPSTIIAIFFIAFCFLGNNYFELGFTIVQIFFVILSLFTLPHSILVEQIYAIPKQDEAKQLQLA